VFAFLTCILRQYVLWEGGIIDGWLLGLETAEVANRLDGMTTLTEGIRDFGPGGKGIGSRSPSLITPDKFIITTARFGAHCVPPMRHLSAPSLLPTDVKLCLSH